MGKADEALRRYAGEENNCDVRLTSVATAAETRAEAYIPVFAGAGIAAVFPPGTPLQAGDGVQRLQDGRRFRVLRLLNVGKDGRIHAQLEML